MSVAIQNENQYLTEYCKAFSIGWFDDEGLKRIVNLKARKCPLCGRKPGLFGDRYVHEFARADGGTFKKYYLSAGVVMCGCGRSGQFFDERYRLGTNRGTYVRALIEPNVLVNRLIDTWNKA